VFSSGLSFGMLPHILAFSILSFIIVHALGRRVATWGRRELQREDDEIRFLEREKEVLADAQRELDAQFSVQDDMHAQLSIAVQQWKKAHEAVRENIAMERVKRQQEVEKKVILQQQTMYEQRLYAQVVPEAHEKARAELIKKFSSELEGRRFLVTVLAYMERESA